MTEPGAPELPLRVGGAGRGAGSPSPVKASRVRLLHPDIRQQKSNDAVWSAGPRTLQHINLLLLSPGKGVICQSVSLFMGLWDTRGADPKGGGEPRFSLYIAAF